MSAISAISKALEDGLARADEESLAAFYAALLEGELLVAAGGGDAALALDLGPARQPVELGGTRDASGHAVLAAFTGDDELAAWAGWGVGSFPLATAALAAAALAAGVDAVSLNPAGPIGRQLDVVELRQLAGGVVPRLGRAAFGFEPRSGLAVAAPATAWPAPLAQPLGEVGAAVPELARAYFVDLMRPRQSSDVDLAVALELDAPAHPPRRQEIVELLGPVLTDSAAARLEGIAFLWLDPRLTGLVRARVAPAYERRRL